MNIVISQATDPVFIDTHLVLICTGSGVRCKKWERERLNILHHTTECDNVKIFLLK